MTTFVTDATVLLPGLQDSQSRQRRLLVLCAYGRLCYFHELGSEEVSNTPEVLGGVAVEGRPLRELQELAGARAATLAEHLPSDARDDCLLVLSTPILDGLEKALRSAAVGADLGMTAEVSQRQRLIVAPLTAYAPTISLSELAARTEPREYALLLETAARGRVEFVVSDSPTVEPFHDQDLQLEAGAAGGTRVCSFDSFLVYAQIAAQIDEIDGSLLHLAVAP